MKAIGIVKALIRKAVPIPTEDWLRIYAAHAHNHAAQIGRLRDAFESSSAAGV